MFRWQLLVLYLFSTSYSFAAPLKQTLWVFPDPSAPNPVTDSAARQTLVANAAASGVAELYVSVYSSTRNSAGRYMYDEAGIADLISAAHTSGMEVLAAYGAPDWPSFACTSDSFPSQRMSEVLTYSSAHPMAAFDGVILDVEPNAETASAFQALLAHYGCMRNTLPGNLQLSVAIRFYWDNLVEYPPGSGISKPVYAHIIDMPMHNVVVMGYRDFAGLADCTNDGIICLDKDEIAYATNSSKPQLILAGVETSDPATTGVSNKETFFEEAAAGMNSELATVISSFRQATGFGGFAVHNYENSYLAGSAAWPARNPSFPTNVVAVTGIARLSTTATRISGIGVPNHAHTFEAALNPNPASFSYVTTVTPDSSGTWHVDETLPANTRVMFYRLSFP